MAKVKKQVNFAYEGTEIPIDEDLIVDGVPTFPLAEYLIRNVLNPQGISVTTRCDQAPEPGNGYRCVYVATVHHPNGYRYEGTPGEVWKTPADEEWLLGPLLATRAREAAVLMAVLEYGGRSDLAQRYHARLLASLTARRSTKATGAAGASADGSAQPTGAASAVGSGTRTVSARANAAPSAGSAAAAATAAGQGAAERTQGETGASSSTPSHAPGRRSVFTNPLHQEFKGLTPVEVYRRYSQLYRWQIAAMLCAEREYLQQTAQTAQDPLLRELDRVIQELDRHLKTRIQNLVAQLQGGKHAASGGSLVGQLRAALPPDLLRRYPGLLVEKDGALAAIDFRSQGMTETEAMSAAAAIADALERIFVKRAQRRKAEGTGAQQPAGA